MTTRGFFLAAIVFLEPDPASDLFNQDRRNSNTGPGPADCVTSRASRRQRKRALRPGGDGQRGSGQEERKCLVLRRSPGPSAPPCSSWPSQPPGCTEARPRRRPPAQGDDARTERASAAPIRQPEIGARELAHRTRPELFGRLALPEAGPADGDHPGIRQLAAGARRRRRRGLDQPVAAFRPPHGHRRAMAARERTRASTCLPSPTAARSRSQSSSRA